MESFLRRQLKSTLNIKFLIEFHPIASSGGSLIQLYNFIRVDRDIHLV